MISEIALGAAAEVVKDSVIGVEVAKDVATEAVVSGEIIESAETIETVKINSALAEMSALAEESWEYAKLEGEKFNMVVESSEELEEVEFEKIYKDDNGDVYRKGDDLVENNHYEINGYEYATDELGRITSAEGKLQVKKHDGRYDMPDRIDKVGKGDQLGTDSRGHLIADRFNGSGGMENLTAQDYKVNQREVGNLEDELASHVNNGEEVYLKIEVKYEEKSFRPTEYHYKYTIDGDTFVKVFKN